MSEQEKSSTIITETAGFTKKKSIIKKKYKEICTE